MLSGFNWLRIGASGGLLWVRWWTFGFWRHGVNYILRADLCYLNIFWVPVTHHQDIYCDLNASCQISSSIHRIHLYVVQLSRCLCYKIRMCVSFSWVVWTSVVYVHCTLLSLHCTILFTTCALALSGAVLYVSLSFCLGPVQAFPVIRYHSAVFETVCVFLICNG
jgi:hypothetical protein